jgi:3',5'-cyclic AMP phosphodiesterase CpdA
VAEDISPVTLVQISDLHFGPLDPATGNAKPSPLVRKLIANTTWFDGVLGHHARGLEHLARFWNTLRTQEPHARLIVSGDLTTCGALVEFSTADAYLSAKLHMPFGPIGLDFPSWRDFAIPGNHDHWPGAATIFGNPIPAVKSKYLSGYPVIQTIPRPGAAPIHLVRINTDSDVDPHGLHRFLAIGDFQTQLVTAQTRLAALTEPGIRVLLLHHSWHKRGVLALARASRGALAQFLEQESIRVILTGHVHTPWVKPFDLPVKGSKPYRVHECRCGTTTQIDKMTYDTKSLLGEFPIRPKWPANTLLVHRITGSAAGNAVWRVEIYVRSRGGFTPIKSQPKPFPV